MAKPRTKERGIEQTLRDLNLPTDVSPEEAAAEAAAQVASAGSDDEGDEGDGIDSEDEQLLDQQQGGMPGMVMADDLDGDDGGIVLPLPDPTKPPKLDPALVPSPATQRSGRGKKPEKPIGVRMSKSITDKVPGAEKVMVYKRVEGKRWFVAEYQREDLASFANFEAFLTRYVRPKHGAGEYDLVGVDGRGNNHELGQVRLIEDPTRATPETGFVSLFEKLMTENRERDEKYLNQQMRGQQDPLQLLAGVMTLKKEMEGEASGGMTDVFKTMLESSKDSGNTMLTLMMAMMQQSQQQMTSLMTLMMQPREDPLMKILLTKLLSDGGLGGGGGGSSMPIPPPPPPQMNIAELLAAMGTFIGPFVGGGGGGDEDYKEMLKTLLLQSQAEKLGIKDMLTIVQQLNGGKEGGTNGFKETIDNLAAVMNIAQNINRSTEPGAAAGFFDAMAALFSNRDFAGSIAQAVRMKMDAKTGTIEQRLQAEGQRILMERRLLEQEKARLLAGGGTLPQGVRPLQQAAPAVQQGAPAAQQTAEVVQNTAPNGGARPTRVQQAAEREIERTGKIPELPANTPEHLQNILSAKDDAERVGKVVNMLIYFAEFDDWKPFSEQILVLIRNGNRGETLRWLQAMFEGFADPALGLFPAEAIRPVMEALNEHFGTVQEQMLDFVSQAEQQRPVTGEELADGPVAAAEPAAAAAG